MDPDLARSEHTDEESSSQGDTEDMQASKPEPGDKPDNELPDGSSTQPGDGGGGDGGAAGQGKPDDEQSCAGANIQDRDDLELDALSGISENSDMIHAEILPNAKYVEMREDLEHRLSKELSTHLRLYPLLPANPSDPTESSIDVASGIRFPNLHCAFKGCVWAEDCSMAQHWASPSHQSSTQGAS